MEQLFFPEGVLCNTPENMEAVASIGGLQKALSAGTVLEERVLLCDGSLSLVLNLAGMRAEIPREEIAVTETGEPCRDIAAITRVGRSVAFVVESICREHGESVLKLSRKKAQEKCLAQYLDHLEQGDVLPARITHFEPFGAFCDIGCGITSLISIDCISVSRIAHPQDRFYLGQFIKAAVRCRDEVHLGTRGRIALTHKELLGTWHENAARFSIGQTVTGIVRSIESYGIFVELAPNLAGLAEYKAGFCAGQTVAVYIKNIIPEKMKVKLVLIDSPILEKKQMRLEYYLTQGNVAQWDYAAAASAATVAPSE